MALKFNINKANNTLVNRMTDGSGFSLTDYKIVLKKHARQMHNSHFPSLLTSILTSNNKLNSLRRLFISLLS